MREPRIIYICDHRTENVTKTAILKEITKSSGDIDVICDKGIMNIVFNVYKFVEPDSELTVNYYEGEDFVVTANKTSLEWISVNRPESLDTFTVDFEYYFKEYNQYTQEDCPQCAGNGWYVSLLNLNKGSMFDVTGLGKLVQEFLKVILTYKTETYGSTLMDIIGQGMDTIDIINSEVRRIVSECVDQLKEYQNTDIMAGEQMTPAERINYAQVLDIEPDYDQGGIYVSIILKSEDEDLKASQINLFV